MLNAFILMSAAAVTPVASVEQVVITPEQITRAGIATAPALATLPDSGAISGDAIVLSGTVVAPTTSTVVSGAVWGGMVQEVHVATLQTVKVGAPLVTLFSQPWMELQREYVELSAQARLSADKLARDESLYADGIISRVRLEESRSAAHLARLAADQRAQALRAGDMNQAAIAKLPENRQLSPLQTVRAQTAGTVVELPLSVGQQVEPGSSVAKIVREGPYLVERAVNTVSKALLEATVLVVVLLYVFLGNVRAAVVVACILPLSALGTFVLMRQFGLSANLMSLGGLAIAIGMLVDAAVVVVENIEAHSSKAQPGMSWLHVIYRAVRDVAVPVTAGMVVIMVVFIPLLTLQGLEGKMFAPVAMTIIFALGASLLLSLTVIPVLSSFMLKAHHGPSPRIVVWMESVYQKVLKRAFGNERVVVGSAAGALVIAIALFMVVGKSFMPVLEEGDLIMQAEKLPSVSLDQAVEQDLAIQRRILSQVPEVTRIVARLGTDELGLDPMGPNETDSFLALKPRSEWRNPDKEVLIDALRKATADYPGINFSFTQPIEMRTSEMLSGVRGDLAIKVYGTDSKKLAELAEQIVGVVQKISGSEDVLTVKNEGVQYMLVDIDRVAAGRLGLSAEQVQNDLRTMIEGRTAGIVIDGVQRLPLLLRGGDETRMSPELFQQIRLPLADGQSVPLSQVAVMRAVDGPVKVERENSSRMAVVRANVRGRDLVGFVDEAKAAVAQQIKLPAGYRLSWGGQFENQQRAAARLAVVVPEPVRISV